MMNNLLPRSAVNIFVGHAEASRSPTIFPFDGEIFESFTPLAGARKNYGVWKVVDGRRATSCGGTT